MKILIMDVVKPMLNDAGSVHRWELISNLAKLGQDVYVIAYKDVAFKNVHVNKLRIEKGMFGKMFSKFRYIILLFRLTKKHNIDILYTRNGLTGLVGWIIKMITGSKLIYELNGILADEWETIRKEGKIGIFVRIKMVLSIHMEKFALKKSDTIIAVTEGIRNYLVNLGISEDKITVIGNGVNIDMFKPMNDSLILQKIRKQYNIKESEYVIVFVGNLAPWQGIEYLIRASSLILGKVPKTKFLIVGDGIMREKLESMVRELELEEKFIFTGRVPYEKVPIFINISDVCVCPSPVNSYFRISGGSSLKIFEYLACGKPVVTGNIRGDGDLVVNSGSGFAVMSEDYAELAGAIIKLLKNEKLRLQMGENGRKTIVKYHSWERIAKKIVEIFEKIIREKG